MKSGWRTGITDFLRRLDENYEQARLSGQLTGSRWNRMLQRISEQIARVMREEMLQPPGEPTYIPPEYLVLLSPEDEAELRGDRRAGFLRGLRNSTAETARSLVGGQTQARSLFVQLKADGSLATNEFVVKAIWDIEQESTEVCAAPGRAKQDSDALREETQVRAGARGHPRNECRVKVFDHTSDTLVCEQVIASQPFTVGRGGKAVHVDLQLPDDPEISRHHVTLHVDAGGDVVYKVVGRNPIRVGTKEVWPSEQGTWVGEVPLHIGKYRLELRLLQDAGSSVDGSVPREPQASPGGKIP